MNRFVPEKHHRQSLRLKNYDYSGNGLYFITICTHNRINFFGDFGDVQLLSNDVGMMIDNWYLKLENIYPNIKCHDFITMPNHFHCIIELNNHNQSIGEIIGAFKSCTINEYIKNVHESNWLPFNGKLWQRNFFEHIIRNEDSYLKIADYIKNNPSNWQKDKYFV